MNLCKECQSETTNPNFCSRKCSVSFNARLKQKPKRKCPKCDKEISHYAAHCRECSDKVQREEILICDIHSIEKVRFKGQVFCRKCRVKSVVERRKAVKRKLVMELGGKCSKCGYDKCIGALHFHHMDPSQKESAISHMSISLDKLRAEARKCILICANCHAEQHELAHHEGFEPSSTV